MNGQLTKLELFRLRQAFLVYHNGWGYIRNRVLVAPQIRSRKPIDRPADLDELSMHTLVGHSGVPMLLWSLASFYAVASHTGQLVIHSDGSLTGDDKALLRRLLTQAQILEPAEFERQHTSELNGLPTIKQRRLESGSNVLLKKLIDPYFASIKKWRLIIDSDVLWYLDPVELWEGLRAEHAQSWMMRGDGQGEPNYVYFRDGSRLDGQRANLNSGIVLYRKDLFNLARLTDYFERLDSAAPRNTHYIEQAGYASCLDNIRGLPIERYRMKQPVDEQTAARHYTSVRRTLLYSEGLERLQLTLLNS